HVERPQVLTGEPVDDALGHRSLDLTEKPDRQVKVGGGSPVELRGRRRAHRHVAVELLASVIGQRQPEERPDLYGTRLAQWEGAQAPGRLGRQPNWELTESMPAARFGCCIMFTSSGVIGGSFITASMARAAGLSAAIGILNLAFLMPRACRNQSKIVSYVTTSGPPSSTIFPSSSGLLIASTMHRAASSRRIGCIWAWPLPGIMANGPTIARSKSRTMPPSSPMMKVKRRIVPVTPVLASSCSPIHREVKYLKCGSSLAPIALTKTTERARAAMAAWPRMRGPSTFTAR